VTAMSSSNVGETILEIAGNFQALEKQSQSIVDAAEMMVETLRNGGKILFCGNGGSAADAQHLAAELMGRFLKDRKPLAALALTVDTSALTAIGNDYGYDLIFARQFEGIGRPGDMLVGISTSGNSRNVINALEKAKAIGARTIGLTGAQGGAMANICDICLRVPSERTDHIQEMHIAVGHILCGLVEEAYC
jgi:D-sedoheptulose 7-phosphate isomerase